MRILVVSEPGVDGVFRYVETLCHYLREQGAAVDLAYSDRRGSGQLGALVRWVRERGGATVNLRTSNRPGVADVGAFWSLWRTVRRLRPDVIHSHSAKAGFLARSLRFCGVKAVQVYHPHAYVGMRPRPGRFDRWYNAIERALGRVACTVTVSDGERRFACGPLRVPPSHLHLVRNGVDLQRFAPVSAAEKKVCRRAHGLPTDLPVLGFLGRSSEQKDPITLYRAFGRLVATRPVCLFHVGKGELDAQLETLIDELGLRGRVFRRAYMEEPIEFYHAVDGFVLTSRYEGLSLAALEALAMDLPLILSDVAGNHDLLAEPLSHGWRAAPGDADGFATAMTAWHDALAEGRPSNHREIARERFDVAETYRDIFELYQELLGWSV